MKKIIAISLLLVFTICLANAQQSSQSNTVNPNIERMRIVNQKIAAERAKAPLVQPAIVKDREAIAQQKAANRAQLKGAPAAQPKSK